MNPDFSARLRSRSAPEVSFDRFISSSTINQSALSESQGDVEKHHLDAFNYLFERKYYYIRKKDDFILILDFMLEILYSSNRRLEEIIAIVKPSKI